MGASFLQVSAQRHWIIKKGLSRTDRMSAALGIFISASLGFEKLQGTFPFSIVSGASSFSPEDLVSNLIGFFSAFKSIPQSQMRRICGEVSVKESYRLWDKHLSRGFSGLRNRTFRPILFPSLKCNGGTNSSSFPAVLTSVRPMSSGVNWVRLKRRFVDGRLVNARRAIDVSSKGAVSPR